MKILVRLPNWLGDMVMSVGFINALQDSFPDASISVIAKKGIDPLLDYFPLIEHRFVFSKAEYKGMRGLYNFGKMIKRQEAFDLFFCLPNSISSAFMGIATGARRRIGYKNELRNIFLTHAFPRPENIHRAEEYVRLISLFTGHPACRPDVRLAGQFEKQDYIVVNVNSEASSRRLPVGKAVSLIGELRKSLPDKIILIGSSGEKAFIDSIFAQLADRQGIENRAGQTRLNDLIRLLAEAKLMLSTDSGPAHLANALGTKTVVLFGAGNENHTAPFNPGFREIVRLGKLSCEPCEKNVCVRYGMPECLQQMSESTIIEALKKQALKNE